MSPRRDLLKLARTGGWLLSPTRGGHLRLEHPEADRVVITSSTPSDHRTLVNTRAEMRRALPAPAPAPARKARPKKKPAPTAKPLVLGNHIGHAREQGTRRIVGQAGDYQIELILDESEAGRSWRVFLTGGRQMADSA